MSETDLCAYSASVLAGMIQKKKISPVELIQQSLSRIETVQSRLNPFAFTYPEEALEKARIAEQAVMRGDALGPLHGIPIAIKDFTPTKGKRTTRGSYAFEHWVPDQDPIIVQRLLGGGGILVGKTTTPEFAYSSFTRSPLWGDTLNPWDQTRSAGGSSGGSGVAVATGCVPLAEGTDMGGSVRIPAALCGIVGLKPSLGRIPMDIINTVFDTISHFGPLARTIDDAALFLRATEGPNDLDITSQRDPMPLPETLLGEVDGIRLAVSDNLNIYAVNDEVAANFQSCCDALAEAGAMLEEVKLDWHREMIDAWYDIWGVYIATAVSEVFESYREKMDPAVVALVEAGQKLDAISYRKTEQIRTRQWHSLEPILRRYDAVLCPTMALPAPDQSASDSDFETVDETGLLHGLDMTCLFNNVAQCPALSVPSGFTMSGLPTAIQIVGRRFDDPTVLRIGKTLERICPWHESLSKLGRRYGT